MISFFKRVLDLNRMAKELADREREIELLEQQCAYFQAKLNSMPGFGAVAKDFDISEALDEQVFERLFEKLEPFLTEAAMDMLVQGFKDSKPLSSLPRLDVHVALDRFAMVHEFRFRIPELHARIRTARLP